MLLIYYKVLAGVLILLVSLGIAFYSIRKSRILKHKETIELGDALASGIFLGAALFHMLPESIATFNELYHNLAYPVPEFICVFGFLFLLFLERLSMRATGFSSSQSIPYILTFILAIHALTEGAALGIGYTFSETFMLFIAIIAHKGSETFALCITLIKHHLPLKHIFIIIILFSLMTPFGIFLGALINEANFADTGKLLEGIFNAFAAGTFLYFSTLHHVHFHEHTDDSRGLIEFSCLVLGAIAMGAIAGWA